MMMMMIMVNNHVLIFTVTLTLSTVIYHHNTYKVRLYYIICLKLGSQV